jgi:hypothetical protein
VLHLRGQVRIVTESIPSVPVYHQQYMQSRCAAIRIEGACRQLGYDATIPPEGLEPVRVTGFGVTRSAMPTQAIAVHDLPLLAAGRGVETRLGRGVSPSCEPAASHSVFVL